MSRGIGAALGENFTLGRAFAASLLSYGFGGAPRPFSAAFAVTNMCNIHCTYCDFPTLDPKILDLERVAILFDRLSEIGVRRLGLFGGEPLVRRDLGGIVDLAVERGMSVTLNTNLLLYPRQKENLRKVRMFFTSLDGDRETHMRARGKGSYDGVLEAIDDILSEGRKVVAICVVTEHNIDSATRVLDDATAHGFQAHFQPECTLPRPSPISEPAWRAFWNGLYDRKRAGAPIASSPAYLRHIAGWHDLSRTSAEVPGKRCAAGHGFFFVNAQGKAYPCVYTENFNPAPPVDMLADGWRRGLDDMSPPCTDCTVGPMVEFNLLYRRPLTALANAARHYG